MLKNGWKIIIDMFFFLGYKHRRDRYDYKIRRNSMLNRLNRLKKTNSWKGSSYYKNNALKLHDNLISFFLGLFMLFALLAFKIFVFFLFNTFQYFNTFQSIYIYIYIYIHIYLSRFKCNNFGDFKQRERTFYHIILC